MSTDAGQRLIEDLRNRVLPEHGGTADSMQHHWNLTHNDSLLHKAAANEIERLRGVEADARRYRYLRERNWMERGMIVVESSNSIKLGHMTLTHKLLDAAIDAAIAASRSTGAADVGEYRD